MKTTVLAFVGTAIVLYASAVLLNAGWTHPPIHTVQGGYRGLSMGQLSTPESERLLKFANALPDPIDPADPGSKKVTESPDVYKNVQVLTDLTENQFLRVMTGLGAWVGGEKGCLYCHNADNMADDSLYTKKVARIMLKMTRHINKDWQAHVGATGPTGATGVTCYTCHRGKPVPAYVWYKGAPQGTTFAGGNYGFGHPNAVNGYSALATDPFSGKLDGNDAIRVIPTKALPTGYTVPIQSAERTYSLMIALSGSLGVNCTFCHNTRAFADWSQSPPQRLTAWQGIQLVRDLNDKYLKLAEAEFPANRLGPTGDGPKVYCKTCHQGASKPLLGANIVKDWPELGGVAQH
jgi:photosynthetic reaction center cytochrome c subunit